MMKKWLSLGIVLLLMLTLCIPVGAADDDEITKDGVIYKSYHDRYLTVTGYTADIPAVVNIPDNVDGVPVTRVERLAFAECTTITAMTLPDSITYIPNGAFYRCANLSTVALPQELTSIGENAFMYCAALSSITIWNSLFWVMKSILLPMALSTTA